MANIGFIYRIKWGNPYTDPPNGLPRVLAEIYVPKKGDEGARDPDCLCQITRPLGCNFSLTVSAVVEPLKEMSQSGRMALRRKRLKRHLDKKYPLFADQFFGEIINKKQDYYAGKTDPDEPRIEVLKKEKETFERLTSYPNELMIYGLCFCMKRKEL
jgi:hypothetical protein